MKQLMKLLGILTILLLIPGVSAQGPPSDVPGVNVGGNNIQVETDDFVVKVVGGQNVPFYFFWAADNPDERYKVMFDAVFEAHDADDNGQYDLGEDTPHGSTYIVLPSLGWDFSDVTEDDEGVHFNMSSTDGMFTFANHLYSSGNDSLKFDVIIDGYDFQNNGSILVFAFKVTAQSGEDGEGETVSPEEDSESLVTFDDAFFEIEETAEDENGDINVGLSAGSEEGEGKLYMAYEQFSGKMVHDPTIGVGGSSVTTLLLIGGGVVLLAVAVIYKRKNAT